VSAAATRAASAAFRVSCRSGHSDEGIGLLAASAAGSQHGIESDRDNTLEGEAEREHYAGPLRSKL
jgi:hypothetical protein